MSIIEKAAERLAARKGQESPVPVKGMQRARAKVPVANKAPVPEKPRIQPRPAASRDQSRLLESQRLFRTALANKSQNRLQLNFDELASAGFLTAGQARSVLAQEFRKIKRQILNRVEQQLRLDKERTTVDETATPANTLMITSALSGEGKSYVSANLALSLAAEVDREVLLVDGDVAKGDLSKNLSASGRPGLGQVLKKPTALSDVILKTNVPQLSLIPAGQHFDNLDELLASELMSGLVHALAEEDPNRIILFDAPPLLITTEAVVLSHHMRQVLLVTEANRTSKDAVAQAVRELGDHPSVMMMLNKASGGGRFGYDYGYGYGHSGNVTEPQETAAVAK